MRKHWPWLLAVALCAMGSAVGPGVRYFDSLILAGGYEAADGHGVTVYTDGVIKTTDPVTAERFISEVPTGTAPLTVASTTLVPNLHVAEADHSTLADRATTADAATTAFDVSDDTNLSASGGVVLSGDALSHDTAAGYKHVPAGGVAGQALVSTGTSGQAAWATGSGSTTTDFDALRIHGGYNSGGASITLGGGIYGQAIYGNTLSVTGPDAYINLYRTTAPAYATIFAPNESLTGNRTVTFPNETGTGVVVPTTGTEGYLLKADGDGTFSWSAPSGVVGNVETLPTLGGSGTAPVSGGAGTLTMVDIATQAELNAAVSGMLPAGGSSGSALLTDGAGTYSWSANSNTKTTPLYALSVGGGYTYDTGSGLSVSAAGALTTNGVIQAPSLTVGNTAAADTGWVRFYENASPITYFGDLSAPTLAANVGWILPAFSGALVGLPEEGAASGTAPVSNGLGVYAWTDIATETELSGKANTAHSHLDAEVADALTVSGGTVNNTPIGASTPSTGAFTTLSATGVATVGSGSGTANAILNGGAGAYRKLEFKTAGSLRWLMGADSAAESGTNAGSKFTLFAYDDSGTLIDTPLAITRASGGAIALARPVTISGTNDLTVGGTTSSARVNTTGGVHVGGTSDPGTDNLIVDGTSTLVGPTSIQSRYFQNGYYNLAYSNVLDCSAEGYLAHKISSTIGSVTYSFDPVTASNGNAVFRLFRYAALNGTGTAEFSIYSPNTTTKTFSVSAATGNVDTGGVYQAGSGNVNLTNSTGNLLWAAMETPTIKETLILTSAGGEPTTTAGCAASAKKETTTNKRNYRSLDFDAGTDESAFWNVTTLPDNCPTGATFTVKVRWKAAGTGNVCWSVASVASSHDDVYDAALGTAVTGTVAVTAAGDEEVSSLGTMTPAGTLQAGDSLYVQLTRDADNASDTVAGDVEVLGVSLEYTPRVS